MHTYIQLQKHMHLHLGRLRGLTDSMLDHRSLSLHLRMGISEGCFIFDFVSLPLEVAQPI